MIRVSLWPPAAALIIILAACESMPDALPDNSAISPPASTAAASTAETGAETPPAAASSEAASSEAASPAAETAPAADEGAVPETVFPEIDGLEEPPAQDKAGAALAFAEPSPPPAPPLVPPQPPAAEAASDKTAPPQKAAEKPAPPAAPPSPPARPPAVESEKPQQTAKPAEKPQPPAAQTSEENKGPPPVPPFLKASEEKQAGVAKNPAAKTGEASDSLPQAPVLPPEVSDISAADQAGEIKFSRQVKVLAGQYVEIPFRGPGWVYLGELGSRRGVYYDSRRIDDDGMTFVFRAEEPGTYTLKFNRQDFIQDYTLDDFVRVIVEEMPLPSGSAWLSPTVAPDRVYASPRWPPPGGVPGEPPQSAAPDTAAASLQSPAAASATDTSAPPATASAATASPAPPASPAAQSSPAADTSAAKEAPGMAAAAQSSPAASGAAASPASTPGAGSGGVASAAKDGAATAALGENALPSEYLDKARADYNAGKIPAALLTLESYREKFGEDSDEALWLYGQALEAKTEKQDIGKALDAYRTLIREYPESARYTDARRRIAYLEKYFIDIR